MPAPPAARSPAATARSRRQGIGLVSVCVLAALLALLYWVWPQAQKPAVQPVPAASVWGPAEKTIANHNTPPSDKPEAGNGAGSASAPGVAVSEGSLPPTGVTIEQWQSFLASLPSGPQREAEVARVRGFLAYQQDLEKLRALRASRGDAAPSAEMKALAQRLDDGLNARLAQREVSAGEAAMLKAATAEVLAPQRGMVPTLVAGWRQQAAAAASAAALPDRREASFAAEQAAIVQAWQAQPTGQRDAAALEQALEAARQRHFGASQPAAPPAAPAPNR